MLNNDVILLEQAKYEASKQASKQASKHLKQLQITHNLQIS